MKKKCDNGLLALTAHEMKFVNEIQLDIFKYFIKICEKNNLKYYAVHGTLLGAVVKNGFFPFDDDIDVAMPRSDYEKFIEIMKEMKDSKYFFQCNRLERDYPLVFGKLRNSNTTFIQPIMDNFKVNKGIYIDIFPIDFCPRNKIENSILKLKEKISSTRIAERFNNKKTFIKRAVIIVSKFLIPSWHKAMRIKDELYSNCNKNTYCMLYGGKTKETRIPFDLFGDGIYVDFEDIKIVIPNKYEEYLNIIYTNYKTYNPAEKLMRDNNNVEISANVVDTEKSYLEYINK